MDITSAPWVEQLHKKDAYKWVEAQAHIDLDFVFSCGSEILLYMARQHEFEDSWVSISTLLLGMGVSPQIRDENNCSILSWCARLEHPELFSLLIKAGLSARQFDEAGVSVLEYCLERHGPLDDQFCMDLLAAGESAKGKSRFDQPYLNLISEHPESSVLAFELLSRGADPSEIDPQGHHALTLAARAGNAAMVSLLIAEGAPILADGPVGLRALDFALGARHPDRGAGRSKVTEQHMRCALRLLKATGPTTLDVYGLPPLIRLWHSTLRFEANWMESLRQYGANPHQADEEGNTLLHWASLNPHQSGHALCVWALHHGVNLSVKNRKNKFAHEVASERGADLIAGLLTSAFEQLLLNGVLETRGCNKQIPLDSESTDQSGKRI